EGEDGQAPLRHDDADHGADDEPDDGRGRRIWRRRGLHTRNLWNGPGRRWRLHGPTRRRRWRQVDEHDSAIDAYGQFRRWVRSPAAPAALNVNPGFRTKRGALRRRR